ncbi:MAG: phosphoribosyltransferase [Stackebrandtia sp.]
MRRMTVDSSVFADRRDAGQWLGSMLRDRAWNDPMVLGLARGGVPVAEAVAEELGAPLDVMVVRKIGAPGNPEFGVGAVAATGTPIYDEHALTVFGLSLADLEPTRRAEQAKARRRTDLYLRGRAPLPREGRELIVVDDGLAAGVAATAALRTLAGDLPSLLVFAAPVCVAAAAATLRAEADDVYCLIEPSDFSSVGQWYRDYRQTGDDEVIGALERARGGARGA